MYQTCHVLRSCVAMGGRPDGPAETLRDSVVPPRSGPWTRDWPHSPRAAPCSPWPPAESTKDAGRPGPEARTPFDGPPGMTRGETPVEGESDTGIALGAGPAGLTVTFGFGPELFERLGGERPSPAG
ncbi:Dyp-type peroxidase domain-containing protein [Streptomyces sp. H27-G5]|uniref:Dyp-type peroxidase domain-containing protein n=1 Tax=Streptomyces sp. H27-G5 TaxID=2996698 RepID=UPI002D1E492E|nr:Dyp-type peroxidase domain-containing protein [Streptomyces sp. H27-G5]